MSLDSKYILKAKSCLLPPRLTLSNNNCHFDLKHLRALYLSVFNAENSRVEIIVKKSFSMCPTLL